jgi:hypothetical protein
MPRSRPSRPLLTGLRVLLCLLVLLPSAQAEAAENGDTPFTARDQSFRLLVPQGWEVGEVDDAGGGGLKVEILTQGTKFLEYVVLRVLHVSAPHKSVERARDELRRVRGEAAFGAVTLAGREALSRERRGVRSLPGIGDEIPNVERVLILPAEGDGGGFFVLTSDLPLALEERRGPELARMLASFQPAPSPGKRPAEVTAEEYAVYAAFLLSGGIAEPGEAGSVAPYLRDTAATRTVYARTVAGPELKPEDTFASCGGLSKALAADYAARRKERVLVSDRLPVPDLRLRAEGDSRLLGLQERIALRPGRHMPDPALEFSRVGFAGDGALFYVTNFGTSPGTSHLVLMVRQGGVWRLRCAGMRDMRIY